MVSKFRHSLTHRLHIGEEWIFRNPKIVLSLILAVTIFGMALPKLRIFTDFSDLLPQSQPHIKVYNRLKENFGGANMIIMSVEVEQGTIFNDDTLRLIHEATQGVDNLPGVNHNLVSSLTHRMARKVFLDDEGGFASESYYDPLQPTRTVAELEQLKKDVIASPTIFGLLVSPDLKAALIKAQLNEADIDYPATFAALQAVRATLQKPGHKIYVSGNPVLTGWVYTYLNQIDKEIGTDLSGAWFWRPFMSQNVVVRLSGALLEPGSGLEDLYGERDPFYTVLGNVILTY